MGKLGVRGASHKSADVLRRAIELKTQGLSGRVVGERLGIDPQHVNRLFKLHLAAKSDTSKEGKQ